MNRLVIILLLVASSAVAQSDFSRSRLFPQGSAELWRRALGIDTNSYVTSNSITNIIIAGTNISLVYSNGTIIINAVGTTNSSSGITNIVLTSTNLIISGSPMSGGGGIFTVDLPFLTNWFVTTNTFQDYTNSAVPVNTNLFTTTNSFQNATNGMVHTITATSNTIVTGTANRTIGITNVLKNPVTQRRSDYWIPGGDGGKFLTGAEVFTATGTSGYDGSSSTAAAGVKMTSAATASSYGSFNTTNITFCFTNTLYFACRFRLTVTNSERAFIGLVAGTAASSIMTNASPATQYIGMQCFSDSAAGWNFIWKGPANSGGSVGLSTALNTSFITLEIAVQDLSSNVLVYVNGVLVQTLVGANDLPTPGTAMNIIIQTCTMEAVAKGIAVQSCYAEFNSR